MANPAQSKGWIKNFSSLASRVYFLLIILQIPFFRVPCRSGMCMSPIHVTSSQLISSEIVSVPMIKTLLYPGAIVNGLATNMTFPLSKKHLPFSDLQRLEVMSFQVQSSSLSSTTSPLASMPSLTI